MKMRRAFECPHCKNLISDKEIEEAYYSMVGVFPGKGKKKEKGSKKRKKRPGMSGEEKKGLIREYFLRREKVEQRSATFIVKQIFRINGVGGSYMEPFKELEGTVYRRENCRKLGSGGNVCDFISLVYDSRYGSPGVDTKNPKRDKPPI